ncbi:M48 family metalloprotease [Pseudanabaena sp. FACHB-1998]|uniref:M48 family metalloprotease n=1 Tax=Pseudanabaena sp. FACHB-1998 TaxID=2692858 RepID=UPI001681703E|nr:M48 family metalloprotease [Pseudanabaena sp. FACHB-1998]
MSKAQFEKLIKDLEQFARQHPNQYKFRVKLLANVGYAYVIFLIVFLIGLSISSTYFGLFFPLQSSSSSINIFYIGFAAIPFTFATIILMSLKTYFSKPKGIEMNRSNAPKLFQFIDDLTSTLKAPKCDHLLLTAELNAGVVQLPSFLMFQENYLLLGLPLMFTLSLEQFRAVVAHELGHLSNKHSKQRSQIYLIRQTWYQVWEKLQVTSKGSTFLINIFLNWYAPFLYAYSFVLARSDEYEADRYAVEITGTKNIAEALISLEINSRYLTNHFWKDLYKRSHQQNLTPNTVYTNLLNSLSTDFSIENKLKFLDLALDSNTNYTDTHPCLSERLTNIGYDPLDQGDLIVPESSQTNAAQSLFFNSDLESYINHFNAQWQSKISVQWYAWYQESQELQMRIEHLERQTKNASLTIDKALELASLILDFKGKEEAISKFRVVLDIDPKNSEANYAIGNIFLEQGDEQGVSHMEIAMEEDYTKVVSGCEILRSFMRQTRNFKAADFYRDRGNRHYQLLLLDQEERSIIKAQDNFIPHNLANNVLKSLSNKLSDFSQMQEAYIVQKDLKYFPEKPLYVLGIVRKKILYDEYAEERDRELFHALYSDLEFIKELHIVHLNLSKWNLKRVLSRIPKSKIRLY